MQAHKEINSDKRIGIKIKGARMVDQGWNNLALRHHLMLALNLGSRISTKGSDAAENQRLDK